MHEELSGVRIMAYTTIDDPSAHFQTTLYTGNSGDNAITNGGNSDLQPDWLWIKNRGATQDHVMFDSSRGFNGDNDSLYLEPNNTDAESHNDNDHVKSFNSDGFTMQGGSGRSNNNTVNFVAWQWKANGGTTASNTDGNLTTTIQVNQTAGFSIVLWTSTGSSDVIGHGLGATPKVIIEKSRSATGDWTFYTNAGGNKLLFLNNGNAVTTSFSGVNSVGSSTFTDGNGGTDTRVAWCFAEKQGYSKFGIYTGNGNADGPFLYTGFKPAWVMFKNLTSGHDWRILDNKRNTFNLVNTDLRPNTNEADSSGSDMDFLSNGIKMKDTDGDLNENGSEQFYMAFAEHPFVSSEGVPTTAR